MKWYALALIIVGLAIGSRAKWPPGEFGLPLYAQAGWLCFGIGVCWIGVLIFVRL
jgi:hypothetical protein